MKAELTRSDWIILRLVRESVRTQPRRVNYEACRAVADLVHRCGADSVLAAIDALLLAEAAIERKRNDA
jgi:hypothetical protein